MSEEGKAKAVAFDEIDKAPEEKKRGITIATNMITGAPRKLRSIEHHFIVLPSILIRLAGYISRAMQTFGLEKVGISE
ncbi:uncharacterized protein LOC131329350 isoform X2 [Rhododendron vialii]|uniref:uncharacterized protein LOC131329350 isoform X2 n=1 Tax=Rhododendron vialii TaxID=182163 RepID=UPI00265E16E1|nr:uncharacterized protein LOC131329350 isoform X2 [Rhododendron vialii]